MSRTAHLLCLALVAVCLAGAVSAQETEPAPPAVPTVAVPEAIAVPEIVQRADSLDARLRTIGSSLGVDDALTRLAKELPERRKALTERENLTIDQVGAENLDGLGDLDREWEGYEVELLTWSQDLTDYAVRLEAELSELNFQISSWQLTAKAARAEGAPDALVARAREALKSVEDTRSRLRERRAKALTVQNGISELQQSLTAVRAAIDDARERLRSRLLQADTPPLWEVIGSLGQGASLTRMNVVATNGFAAVREYLRPRQTIFALHAIVFGLAMLLTLYLRPRARNWAEQDEGFREAARLFERPIAMAALIALLATPWVYPNAPKLLLDFMGLLLIIPLLRVMWILLDKSIRPAAYALALLYLVDQLRELISGAFIAERLLFGLQVIAALAGLLWMLRPSRLGALSSSGPWFRALGVVARVGVVLLAGSLLLNLFGFMSLAKVLGEGSLRTAYVGVLGYVGVTLLDGMLRAILRTWPLSLSHVIRSHRFTIVRRARWLVRAIALLLFASASLSFFTIDEWVMTRLTGVLTAQLTVGSLSISLGDVLAFVTTIVVALMLARGLRAVLEEDVVPRVSLPRGVGYAASATAQYAIAMIGFFMAVTAAGIDLNRFAIIAGAFGVGLGFGLQNVVNNFVSGIILLFERPVQVGDTVETEGVLGDVRRIGIRSSTIRTWQGAEVIVPNSFLISERVVNWTMSDRQRRIDVTVGVAYGTDPQVVLDILHRIAAENNEVLNHPPAEAFFRGFGDSSLDFELRGWTPQFENWHRVQSDLAVAINTALAEADITIPFPQRDLHVISS